MTAKKKKPLTRSLSKLIAKMIIQTEGSKKKNLPKLTLCMRANESPSQYLMYGQEKTVSKMKMTIEKRNFNRVDACFAIPIVSVTGYRAKGCVDSLFIFMKKKDRNADAIMYLVDNIPAWYCVCKPSLIVERRFASRGIHSKVRSERCETKPEKNCR